jgi:endonuclease/exonuclease/phosphatase family metal-dependent hydrolase
MSEIKVGSWNALNAFGDETLSQDRLNGALEVVKSMDADVVAIPETARHGVHGNEIEQERIEEVKELMAQQGYTGYVTDYTSIPGERNAHYMSIWTRVGHVQYGDAVVQQYGKRNALGLWVPDMQISVHGVHLDDRYPKERVKSAGGLLVATSHTKFYASEAIVMGDFNDMYRNDPKGRIPRTLGKVINGIEVKHYYDPSKRVQRLVGQVVRVCRMSGGDSLELFAEAGFKDADPLRQPTIGKGRMAFQLDHILGSAGVQFHDFTAHDRSARPNSQPLSDHSPITARAIRG